MKHFFPIGIILLVFNSAYSQNIEFYDGERVVCSEVQNDQYHIELVLNKVTSYFKLTRSISYGAIPHKKKTLIITGKYNIMNDSFLQLKSNHKKKLPKRIIYEIHADSLTLKSPFGNHLFSLRKRPQRPT